MDQAVSINNPLGIIEKPKADTIFCPGCGEELDIPKPKVEEVVYHPSKVDFYSYGSRYSPYVEVHFQEKVTVGHKCPDPNRDRAGAAIEDETRRQLTRARKLQLWNAGGKV